MNIKEIARDDVTGVDLPRMIFILVEEAYRHLWSENTKLHDIGGLMESIKRYGFQELPKYDATLGAFKAGNGRVEALYRMLVDEWEVPRGVGMDKHHRWVIPVMVGTDQNSKDFARAYAIESNNMTMAGGDFTGFEMERSHGGNYRSMLYHLAEQGIFCVSVPVEQVDAFRKNDEIQVDVSVAGTGVEKSSSPSITIEFPHEDGIGEFLFHFGVDHEPGKKKYRIEELMLNWDENNG